MVDQRGVSKPHIQVVTVPLSANEAMQLLLEGSSVATWFGASHANIDPKKGGKYEIFWHADDNADSTKSCVIKTLTANNLIVQWRGPSKHASFDGMEKPGSTLIEFKLETDGESTAILIDHIFLDKFSQEAADYFAERWKIWGNNLSIIGAIAGKFKAIQDMAQQITKKLTNNTNTLMFIPEPNKGKREPFDFSKITLDSNELFGNQNVLRNLVDQA